MIIISIYLSTLYLLTTCKSMAWNGTNTEKLMRPFEPNDWPVLLYLTVRHRLI